MANSSQSSHSSHSSFNSLHQLSPHQLGRAGEAAAVDYLLQAGYSIIDQNWRGSHGEIDIIASDKRAFDLRYELGDSEIVIVEVKTRSSYAFGAPFEAITPNKYRRLFLLGREWVGTYQPGAQWRIDVLALICTDGGFRFTHHKGLIA